jgi:uncharacterized protein YndB with AHSA1/START domain
MFTEGSIEIEAPASVVWDVFTDVERWSEWTASIERIVALDGAAIEVGKRFEIKQPRMPKLIWEVTEVEPGVSWTWRQKAPGSTAFATHEVTAVDGARTVVERPAPLSQRAQPLGMWLPLRGRNGELSGES